MHLYAIEERSADFSPCRTYRYRLIRRWADGPMLNVIGLNPSVADETVDDPTIRRCVGFAKSWGYSGLIMTNLCAFRATDPAGLLAATIDPEGPMNLAWLRQEALASGLVLAAWGAHPVAMEQGQRIMRSALDGVSLRCLGTTQAGAPRHPLYVKAITPHVPFPGAEDGGSVLTTSQPALRARRPSRAGIIMPTNAPAGTSAAAPTSEGAER